MIERDLANVFDLELSRPDRTGPSQDPVGDPATLASGLCAVYEPFQAWLQEPNGRQVRLSAKIWIDPIDNDGDAITVAAGDWAQWTDFRGVLVREQVIVTVSPWFVGTELDHIQLDIGRR